MCGPRKLESIEFRVLFALHSSSLPLHTHTLHYRRHSIASVTSHFCICSSARSFALPLTSAHSTAAESSRNLNESLHAAAADLSRVCGVANVYARMQIALTCSCSHTCFYSLSFVSYALLLPFDSARVSQLSPSHLPHSLSSTCITLRSYS